MPKETTLTDTIQRAARALGCIAIKKHGSLYGRGGEADLSILVPVSYQRYPVSLFVEVKRWGNAPTERQRKRLRDLAALGSPTLVAWSVEQVVQVIGELREGSYDHSRTV
jgi:hypothetical protein